MVVHVTAHMAISCVLETAYSSSSPSDVSVIKSGRQLLSCFSPGAASRCAVMGVVVQEYGAPRS